MAHINSALLSTVGMLCSCLVSLCLSAELFAAPPRPNIIVILSDDMGFSDLGCYGGEIHTPVLDKLAAGGVRFQSFYNTARCCPTRASLLTGLYPHQAGIGHMMDDSGLPGYTGNLNASTRTIAELLKPAGYHSYATGKWHVTRHTNADGPRHNWPLQRGFERFYGTIHGAGSFYDPSSLVRDNKMISAFADPEYKPDTYYYTDAIAEHAIRFVRGHAAQHSDAPFFLYVAFTAAHWPMHALPEDIRKYSGRYDAGYDAIRKARFQRAVELGLIDSQQGLPAADSMWETVPDKRWEAAGMEVYAAMVDRMDQGIGRLTAELEQLGKLDNTLILYLQDNGGCAEPMGRMGTAKHPDIERPSAPTLPPLRPDAFAAGGSVPSQTRDGFPVRMGRRVYPGPADTYIAYGKGWANVSNTPFREYKHWVHEGGISTPLVAHWPAGAFTAGSICRTPGHLIDIAATCCDLAGVTPPADNPPLEGISLLPALRGQPIERKPIYWEHEGNRAVRSGKWKLVAKHNGPWELYQIDTDRIESHNLAETHPEVVQQLEHLYKQWAERAMVAPWPLNANAKEN
jgi:arylsulfatase